MTYGIDKISFYTPHYFLDLKTLAEQRGIDPEKFYTGIGQQKMAILPPDEDVVTMAANAAVRIAQTEDLSNVELLLFATESGIDQSKAAGLFVHKLLDMPARCRVIELKQACYSGTAALQLACNFTACHPGKRALVIASDKARYELESPGESTQGGGAVAMLVSAGPRLVALDQEYGCHAEDVMDFWRPNYRSEAVVDGKYSTLVYIRALLESWAQYKQLTGRTITDFSRFCYHIPFTKMAHKAHAKLCRKESLEPDYSTLEESLIYSTVTGNCYAASMYVGLCSLLENCEADLSGKRIGFYSYGSGCVGEFFSGTVLPGYRSQLYRDEHQAMLAGRIELSYQQYEDIYNFELAEDGTFHELPRYKTAPFRLAGLEEHKRLYEPA